MSGGDRCPAIDEHSFCTTYLGVLDGYSYSVTPAYTCVYHYLHLLVLPLVFTYQRK
jgi:hypothetical protein